MMEKLHKTPTFEFDKIQVRPAEAVATAFNRLDQPILTRAAFTTFIIAVIVAFVLAESVLVTFAILPFANALLLQIAFVLVSIPLCNRLIDFSNSSSKLEE